MSKHSKEAFGTGKNGEVYPLEAWHLHLFGILPQFQGKGYGKKLVQFAEAEVGTVVSISSSVYYSRLTYLQSDFIRQQKLKRMVSWL